MASRMFELEVLAVVKVFFSEGMEANFTPSEEQLFYHNHEEDPF